MFIETSSPRHSGDKARLIGPSISGSGQPVCFTFWYNMFGDHVAALNIYVKKGSSLGTPVWTRSGAQGSAWKQAQVQFTPTTAVMVRTNTFITFSKLHFQSITLCMLGNLHAFCHLLFQKNVSLNTIRVSNGSDPTCL